MVLRGEDVRLTRSTRLQTFIRNATGKALADSPALNPLSRQVLVPVARPNLPPPAVVVPGPGPPEPTSTGAISGTLVQMDGEPAQNGSEVSVANGTNGSNGASAHLMGTTASQETPSNEGDDDESLVSPPASVDPYAALDSAFGGYMADEPRPQNKDLLDMI